MKNDRIFRGGRYRLSSLNKMSRGHLPRTELLTEISNNMKSSKGEQQTEEDKIDDKRIAEQMEKSFEIECHDTEKQPTVGVAAVTSFYNHYKKLKKIKDKNDLENTKPSLFTSILTKCEDLSLLPEKMGIVKYSGLPEHLNISNSRYGTKYLKAFSEGIKELNLTSCFMNSSRINNEAIDLIAPNLPKNLVSISMKNNEIGAKGIEAFHKFMKDGQKLMQLDLSNNKLTDAGVINLCNTLNNHPKIKILNISRNGITCRSCSHLATLISTNTFEQIFLQWNKIQSKGGKQILDSMVSNQTVKVLDMSWNLLGNCLDSCNSLCNMIKNNTQLIHTDFSGNYFNKTECTLISEALKSNSTIVGFHFRGNFGYVDSQGFLIVEDQVNTRDYRQVTLHRKIQVGGLKNKTKNELFEKEIKNCCWVCDGWIEQEFTYTNDNPNSDIWVYFSFEGYKPRYVGRWDDSQVRFRYKIPPRKIYFFFTSNQQLSISRNHGSVFLPDNNMIKNLEIAGEIRDTYVQQRNVINGVFQQPDEESIRPRTPMAQYRPNTERKQQMRVVNYDIKESKLLENFEHDWELVCQTEQNKQLILEHYADIHQCYKYYSCHNTTDNNGFYIDKNAVTMLVDQCGINCPDLSDILDRLSKKPNMTTELYDNELPYNSLSMNRLIEFMVIVGIKKCRGLTCMDWHRRFRHDVLYLEECDLVLKANRKELDELFYKSCSSLWKLGQRKYLLFEDFRDIFYLRRLDEDYQLTVTQLRLAFFYSKRGDIDYHSSDCYRRLFRQQFPEAIARIACQVSMPGNSKEKVTKLLEDILRREPTNKITEEF